MSDNLISLTDKILHDFIEKIRPPEEIRSQVDLGYSFDGKNIEIFERRPIWNEPSKFENYPFAKITYTKSSQIWKLYWKRASGKWESYSYFPSSTHLEELLSCIDEDAYACFKG
ncbi:MAG: DUF3024 domain-containing protein [Saprospiraceae bacterium]